MFLSHPVCLQLAPATLSSPGLQEIILSHFLSCHTCLSFSFSFHLLSLNSDKHWHVQSSALRPLLCFRSIPWVTSPNPMAFRTTCILTTCKLIRPAQTYSACPLGCLRRNITCQNITRQKPDSFPLPKLFLQQPSSLSERQPHSFSSSGQAARSRFFPVTLSPHQSISKSYCFTLKNIHGLTILSTSASPIMSQATHISSPGLLR